MNQKMLSYYMRKSPTFETLVWFIHIDYLDSDDSVVWIYSMNDATELNVKVKMLLVFMIAGYIASPVYETAIEVRFEVDTICCLGRGKE